MKYTDKTNTGKSGAPHIVAGVVCLVYAAIFKPYIWYHYIPMLAVAVIAFVISNRIIKPKNQSGEEYSGSAQENGNVWEEAQKNDKTDNEMAEHLKNCEIYLYKSEKNSDEIYKYNPKLSNDIKELIAESNKILAYAEKHEGCEEKLKKLLTYYIPQLEKLTTSYIEFRQNNVAAQTVKDIEETIPQMKDAFHSFLEKLFSEREFDVATDIDVLEDKLKILNR